jgi:type III secretion protein R
MADPRPTLLWSTSALAVVPAAALVPAAERIGDSPISGVLLLALLSLAGFAVVLLTSFVKIAVVLSILRSALGTPQIPPTLVITGLAFVLSIHVMSPVGLEMIRRAKPELAAAQAPGASAADQVAALVRTGKAAVEPLRAFLRRHAHPRDRELFLGMARRMHAPADRATVGADDLRVLVPAFLTSELAAAFMIGFFIFLPFLVVDLVVANVLLAMGMHMLSPTTVSLPFKLLLFVLVDGWALLSRGLVASYL